MPDLKARYYSAIPLQWVRAEMSFPSLFSSGEDSGFRSFLDMWGDRGHHTWGVAIKAGSRVFHWIPLEVHLVTVAELHTSEHGLAQVDELSSVGTRGRVLSSSIL